MAEVSLQNPANLATLALWSLPGVGSLALQQFDNPADLYQQPIGEWLGEKKLAPAAIDRARRYASLASLADEVLSAAARGNMNLAFSGDANYPANLVGLKNVPPVLFYFGEVGRPRRRVAMVGTRKPDQTFHSYVKPFTERLVSFGVGIVSGAAEGVDRWCHNAALKAGGETWAFLGSALDEIDAGVRSCVEDIVKGHGCVWSEFPPGVRADETTFPRRNRLISGSSDAVLIVQAPMKSGALHTARYAREQKRALFAFPTDLRNTQGAGGNALITEGKAKLCSSPEELVESTGQPALLDFAPKANVDWSKLSESARAAYQVLTRVPADFESVMGQTRLESALLASALCELELSGLVIQHPGKRYEKV